jgi:hypothetical protein
VKIILEAFNKMTSKPIDVPENTSLYFDMVLAQPSQDFCGYDGKEISRKPLFLARCRFEYTGKSILLKDLGYDSEEFARCYVLTDITK